MKYKKSIIEKMADLGIIMGKHGTQRSEYQLGKPISIFFESIGKGIKNNHPINEIFQNARYQIEKTWKRDYDNISKKSSEKLNQLQELFYQLLEERYNKSLIRMYRDENFIKNTYLAYLRSNFQPKKEEDKNDD
ncbi:MAG: hypothetical protein ACOC56_03985 [Atribacterota bacterium]